MASDEVRTVTSQVSKAPVSDVPSILAFIERELKPIVNQARLAINEFMPRPRIPIFDSVPVTDDDFDPTGRNPPKDGVISIGGDGKGYVRMGSSTHQVFGAP